eukprot:TRINITY_DN18392_c1_g2_i1.p1 TRINITY_DN18392_c1_g2~~TRINITY_DN18392_c1_g2_i1.p1  ORF type:complete len:1824 (-),score=221.46 TRINITY_DN18392_c1_g2_i1:103-5382(-)
MTMRDPGKGYPAISTCVAREVVAGQALPPLSDLTAEGQKCHYRVRSKAKDSTGRVTYETILKSRLRYQATDLRLTMTGWGGMREEMWSCGLRGEQMVGPGGCGQQKGTRQKAKVVVSVRSFADSFIFIGPEGGQGYEIVLAAYHNKKILLRKGYASDYKNADKSLGAIVSSYSHVDKSDILDWQNFHTFWFESDPVSGWTKLGVGEIIGQQPIIEFLDPYPVQDLDVVMVGAGFESEGTLNNGFKPDFKVCPAIGNLALNRKVYASSVAFSGTPDKAVDGQWGNMRFCEYCKPTDTHHVCASTRRQTMFNPPYFRIDLGDRRDVGYVRIVGPRVGDGAYQQTSKLEIYVGDKGYRSDYFCTMVEDARGDNLYQCDPSVVAIGRYVSIWANVYELQHLPEEFGMRICEIEVYERAWRNTRMYEINRKFKRGDGLEAPLVSSTTPQDVVVGGLMPNRSYEVFCFANDKYDNVGISAAAYVQTTDTSAPKAEILRIHPGDLDIKVSLSIDDAGNAYPVEAKCIATKDGRSPQEHEVYLEHRFWRLQFKNIDKPMPVECGNTALLRSVAFMSHKGETFKKDLWSVGASNPEDFEIGYDSDGDSVPDQTQVPLYAMEIGKNPYVAIDLHAPPKAMDVLAAKYNTMLVGDLTVSVTWDTGVGDIELALVEPGSYTSPDGKVTEVILDNPYKNQGWGGYGIHCTGTQKCTDRINTAMYVIARDSGAYELRLSRTLHNLRHVGQVDIRIKSVITVCGQERVINSVIKDYQENITVSDNIVVPMAGCSRPAPHTVAHKRLWQSTQLKEVRPLETTIQKLSDNHPHTCIHTGGKGRNKTDPEAYFRTDLGRELFVEGVWLWGTSGPDGTKSATHADVWVTAGAAKKATEGKLCSKNVPIGQANESMNGPVAITCPAGTRGSHVWFVTAEPEIGMSLCEMQIFTTPLNTVSKVQVEFGMGNGTATSCGSHNVSLDWSDDNVTWTHAWTAGIDPSVAQTPIVATWPWWQRLFSLPFNLTYHTAGVQNLTIPHLKENTTYDVMCWAKDSLGNDLTQYLVSLPLPWAETRYQESTNEVDYGAAKERRLQGMQTSASNDTLDRFRCTGVIRELLPCEEKIITTDNVAPKITKSMLVQVNSTNDNYLSGLTEMVTWEFMMEDPSCIDRIHSEGVKCKVRCEVHEPRWTIAPFTSPSCVPPKCVEDVWNNERPLILIFRSLRPGNDYTLKCEVSDPWGNSVRADYPMLVPQTTLRPLTPEDLMYTRGPTTERPSTTKKTTTPRPTAEPAKDWGYGSNYSKVSERKSSTNAFSNASWWYESEKAKGALTTSWRPSAAQVSTTSTSTTTIWKIGSGSGAVGPIRAAVVFGAATRGDAEMMMIKTAALKTALRTSLSLNRDDVLTIEGIEIVSTPSGGRRLASTMYEVRVRFTVKASGQAHSRNVLSRVIEISSSTPSTSGVKALLSKALLSELKSSGVEMAAPVVLGGTTLEDGASWESLDSVNSPNQNAGSLSSSQPSRVSQPSNEGSTIPGLDGSESNLMIPVLIGIGAFLVLGLSGYAVSAFCCRQSDQRALKKGKKSSAYVADANLAVPASTTTRNSKVTTLSLTRVADDAVADITPVVDCDIPPPEDEREKGFTPSASSRQQPRINRSSSSQRPSSRSSKEAWGQMEGRGGGLVEKKESPPISRCSTATGSSGRSGGIHRPSQSHPSSNTSPASSARLRPPVSARVTDLSGDNEHDEQVEIRSCTSVSQALEVSSPSRLPLHGHRPASPPELT